KDPDQRTNLCQSSWLNSIHAAKHSWSGGDRLNLLGGSPARSEGDCDLRRPAVSREPVEFAIQHVGGADYGKSPLHRAPGECFLSAGTVPRSQKNHDGTGALQLWADQAE